MRLSGLGALGAVVAVLASTVASATPAGASLASPGCMLAAPPSLGLSRVASKPVDERTTDLTLRSTAMAGDQHVNILFPAGYDPSGATRYPVLYLLHGSFGSYRDWVAHGVKSLLGSLPVIVVMPDDGVGGSYSDWYGTLIASSDHPPAWESYHLRELIPYIDSHYPTRASRQGRFIAGLSSGGAGAAKYAAANPGLFGAVGSFSGAVNTDLDYPRYPLISEALWGISDLPTQGPDGHCTWGDPVTQHVVWLDNDPTYLAQNLKGTALYVATGDGSPGALDSTTPGFDPTEYEVHAMAVQFLAALDAAAVAHTDELYGHGTHTWPYWHRDLQHFLTWLTPLISSPAAAPRRFSMRSARSTFAAWGWQFVPRRDVREFTYLTQVSRGGLAVVGSGALAVTTAPLYSPSRLYRVSTGAGRSRDVVSDVTGRLSFTLDLGPSHQSQQSGFDAAATAGWTHLQVHITPRRR